MFWRSVTVFHSEMTKSNLKIIIFPVSYSLDLSTGLVSGSLAAVLGNLTTQTEQLEVLCCTNGVVSPPTQPCGGGVSCEDICGENKAGKLYPSKPFITILYRQGDHCQL